MKEDFCSYLKLNTNLINFVPSSDFPAAIYRDFDSKKARDNFLEGNIWFSGPNQNRFFLKDENRRDAYEYRNEFGSFLFEYSASFSKSRPSNAEWAIMVTDINGFIAALKKDLEQITDDKSHEVTWLKLDELTKYISILPVISNIKKYPTQDEELVYLNVHNISARQVTYDKKITVINNSNELIKIPTNARNKNADYIDEEEFRICLNTSDFLLTYNGNSLQNLVKYLKLSTPNISKFCVPIN